MSSISRSIGLRRALLADAVVSGATGLLLLLGASVLAPLFALPEPLLRYAGLVLLPFAACVAYIATRSTIARAATWVVIVGNALWALASVGLLVSGWVAPSMLGSAFVLFQAAAVAVFAELQYTGMRHSTPVLA